MHRRQPDRSKRFDDDASGAQGVSLIRGNVDDPERVIQDEHAHAGSGPIHQDAAERVRHPARRSVVQLQRDRLTRRRQIRPQSVEPPVTVLHQLDAVAR